MKIRNTLTALALACASFAVPALADSEITHVNVPFAFVAGTKKLPAGEYTFRLSDSGQTVFVLGSTQSSVVTALPSAASESNEGLVFKQQNGNEYLVGIQANGMQSHSIPVQPLR
jgi:hypothetical protein